jgi:hypothetical protein
VGIIDGGVAVGDPRQRFRNSRHDQ